MVFELQKTSFIPSKVLKKDRFVKEFMNHFSTLQWKLYFLSDSFVYSSIWTELQKCQNLNVLQTDFFWNDLAVFE